MAAAGGGAGVGGTGALVLADGKGWTLGEKETAAH